MCVFDVYINTHNTVCILKIFTHIYMSIYIHIIYIINKYIKYINVTYFSEIYTCMCVYLQVQLNKLECRGKVHLFQ